MVAIKPIVAVAGCPILPDGAQRKYNAVLFSIMDRSRLAGAKSRQPIGKVGYKASYIALIEWNRLIIHQLPTVMIDIKLVLCRRGAYSERVPGAESHGPGKMAANECEFNRSTQHLLAVYWQGSGTLKFFAVVG
jgi:hypothetical protein